MRRAGWLARIADPFNGRRSSPSASRKTLSVSL